MDHDLTPEAIDAHDRQRMPPPEVQQRLMDQLVAHIRDYQPCLDAGAGTGMITIPLARAGVAVTALDASPEMLDVFRSRLGLGNESSIPLVLGDIQEMPFSDATFGSALVANVFHLVPEWTRALSEIRRVLRHERRLLVNLGGAGRLSAELAGIERSFHDLIAQGNSSSEQVGVARDAQSFDDLAARLGFQSLSPIEVTYSEMITPESIIGRLERNIFARQPGVSDDAIRLAAAQTRDVARRDIGTLDRAYERTQRIVYRCYA